MRSSLGRPTMSELRFQRLSELRQQASDELGQPIDSDDVVLLAAHRLSRDSLLAKLTEGSGDPERLSRENAYNPAWRVMSSSTSSVWVAAAGITRLPRQRRREARQPVLAVFPRFQSALCDAARFRAAIPPHRLPQPRGWPCLTANR